MARTDEKKFLHNWNTVSPASAPPQFLSLHLMKVASRMGPLSKHATTSKHSVAIFYREFPIPLRFKVTILY